VLEKNPWGTKPSARFKTQEINDQLFEIVGLTGVFHMAAIQAGISKGERLGQGKHILIKSFKTLPLQIDGEPWLLAPSICEIKHGGTMPVSFNANTKRAVAKMERLGFNRDQTEGASNDSIEKRPEAKVLDEFLKHSKYIDIQKLRQKAGNKQPMDKNHFNETMNSLLNVQLPNESLLIGRLFSVFDTNKSGTVDFDEFLLGLGILTSESLDEKLKFSFSLFDLDGNNVINSEELEKMFESILGMYYKPGPKLREIVTRWVTLTFDHFDKDQDGNLSYDEFVEAAHNDARLAKIFFLGIDPYKKKTLEKQRSNKNPKAIPK